MRISIFRLQGLLAVILCFSPITQIGLTAFAEDKDNEKSSPASVADIFLYRGLGASYLCNARAAGIEFPKAVGVAAATYVQVLNGRHGGFVASAGKKKLTNKQLFAGAEFQIITAALQYCPKEVPSKVKKKVEDAIKKQKRK